MDSSSRSLEELVLPAPNPRRLQRNSWFGFGLLAIAALGEVAPGSGLAAARVVLSILGVVLLAYPLAQLPGRTRLWLMAFCGCLLAATVSIPSTWDSYRLFASVLAASVLAGTILTLLSLTFRFTVISLWALFHFGGIFTATTLPDPTPWWSSQANGHIYQPYLSFLYMRNAYHFYSPDPGPASHVFVLLTYEKTSPDGNTESVSEWVTLPRRDKHMKDPLGLTYYRRLSITEMVSGTIPDLYTATSFEKADVRERRVRLAGPLVPEEERIPLADTNILPEYAQYRVPRPDITRYLLPSYAQHLAAEYSQPGYKVVRVKIYRAEHTITTPSEFVKNRDVYHPVTYRVYFLGDYDDTGKLLDSQDPMLYWLVPVVPKPNGPSPNDPEKRDYDEYLSRHAKFQFDWRKLRP